MTGFRRRDPDAAAVRGGAGDDRTERRTPRRHSPLRCLALAGAMALLAGCQRPQVEILANNNVVFGSSLGGDRLLLDSNLGISGYAHPPDTLVANVDAPTANVELLFWEQNVEDSFVPYAYTSQDCTGYLGTGIVCIPTEPARLSGVGVGFLHPGGAHVYHVGQPLLTHNPDQAAAIKSFYMRKHGECEAAVRWDSALPGILSKVKTTSGTVKGYDYKATINKKVATSYLRVSGTQGQGGMGIYAEGRVSFDSPLLGDMDFKARTAYDVTLADGLPTFSVSAGPYAWAGNCSSSPFVTCRISDVEDAVKGQFNDAAGQLNKTLMKCLQAPITKSQLPFLQETCTDNTACAEVPGDFLGQHAQQEAAGRGATGAQASSYHDALTDPNNWVCDTVSPDCASLTGTKPYTNKVCQLKLRATDVVPMPDQLDLVWYSGGLPGSPTGAAALYLALKSMQGYETYASQATAALSQLCSGTPGKTTTREFVKVSEKGTLLPWPCRNCGAPERDFDSSRPWLWP